jgi:hypothetical protein
MSESDYLTTMIKKCRGKALAFLQDQFQTYGHFPLLDYYPVYEPRKDKGWHFNYESPFVHTSVLDALINAGFSRSEKLIQGAAEYLYRLREPGDLWRFWKIHQAEHPIFCDVDETSICSFTLRKLGYRLNNQKILYSRIRADGAVPTWIEADTKLLLINPISWVWLKYYDRQAMPTIRQWGWVTFDDAEPAVAANVIAYLGYNKLTEQVYSYVVRGWYEVSEVDYQYYDKKIILAFHIARAFKEGVLQFKEMQQPIREYLISHVESFSFTELLLSYLSLYYFDKHHNDLGSLKNKLLRRMNHNEDIIYDNYPYTTEKGRIYFGGGGCLTAAWFLESSKDW